MTDGRTTAPTASRAASRAASERFRPTPAIDLETPPGSRVRFKGSKGKHQ
jgi:hypothetical protein